MGAQQSKTDVLKEVLNEVSMNVLNKNTTTATGVIEQKNEFNLSGAVNVDISGIKQVNSAKINVSALSSSAASGDLQSDLSASITEAITQEAPAIGYSANETSVRSIVSNSINSNITMETLNQVAAHVKQQNVINLSEIYDSRISPDMNQKMAESLLQKNEAENIVKLISDTNSEIISRLTTEGAIVGELSQTTASFFDFGGGIMILIALLVLGVGGIIYVKKKVLFDPIMNAAGPYGKYIGGAIAVTLLLLLIFYFVF